MASSPPPLSLQIRVVCEFSIVSMMHHPQASGRPTGKNRPTKQLVRSLTLKKRKGDASSNDVKGVAGADKKKAAERVLECRYSAKRANMQASSRQEGTNSHTAEEDFHSLTVERLCALLKERGLSPKGKKNELIARLNGANSQV